MSKITGLDKASLAELKDLRTRVEQAIAERQISERASLREKMMAMATEAGFSIDELVGGKPAGKAGTRAPVAIKYRNPKDPTQTWTGRGRPPLWMVALMKKGAKKESFLIK